ncbi:MAG: hypothetical protein GDA43_05555 [Hormoscilla sp. SP5CHS1]|nr:hypothetical protein [Hormoscilla sp. SP12CHS1]MBC6452724.1 hypothetical protein [Hormoscilla sp. SP5CHS1]
MGSAWGREAMAIAQPAPGHGGIHIIILTEISLMPCLYRKWRSPDRITFAIAER